MTYTIAVPSLTESERDELADRGVTLEYHPTNDMWEVTRADRTIGFCWKLKATEGWFCENPRGVAWECATQFDCVNLLDMVHLSGL